MRRYKFGPGKMIRLGGIFWKKIGTKTRAGLNQRAVYLNSMTPNGVFVQVPLGVNKFQSSALRSLTTEFNDLDKTFQSSIKRALTQGSGMCVRTFCPFFVFSHSVVLRLHNFPSSARNNIWRRPQ